MTGVASAQSHSAKTQAFDVQRVRDEFPALRQSVHGKPLVYLDSAATTQKPQCVIDAIAHFYEHDNSNVHRGVHALSQRATDAFENARETVRKLLSASDTGEIIFTRGATEAINLVAQSYGRSRLQAGDEILISTMEHHSNIVPWQILCEQTGATLKIIPINDDGEILLDEYAKLLSRKTKIVSVVHVSNALGTINPIKQMAAKAHEKSPECVFLADGAQAMAHLKVDVRDLGVDFYAVSAHKMYGPTGIGALYGRRELLEAMPPWHGGGDMIKSVTFEKTIYNDLPFKFEAGTPNIAGAIGFAAAADFLNRIGLDTIAAHEDDLTAYALPLLRSIDGLRLVGNAKERSPAFSFVLEGIDAYTAAVQLDQMGIAVRVGHHCTEPLMKRFGLTATMRATSGVYTTHEELDALAAGLRSLLASRLSNASRDLRQRDARVHNTTSPSELDVPLDRIIETFEFLDEWEARYEYLLDLEKKLPDMPASDRTEESKVHGCQSQVWMKAELVGNPPRMKFSAISDAAIVNGLIYILLAVYNGKTPREILDFDAPALFKRLGLVEHLSPTRRNGLHSMIARIRELAAQHEST